MFVNRILGFVLLLAIAAPVYGVVCGPGVKDSLMMGSDCAQSGSERCTMRVGSVDNCFFMGATLQLPATAVVEKRTFKFGQLPLAAFSAFTPDLVVAAALPAVGPPPSDHAPPVAQLRI